MNIFLSGASIDFEFEMRVGAFCLVVEMSIFKGDYCMSFIESEAVFFY